MLIEIEIKEGETDRGGVLIDTMDIVSPDFKDAIEFAYNNPNGTEHFGDYSVIYGKLVATDDADPEDELNEIDRIDDIPSIEMEIKQ